MAKYWLKAFCFLLIIVFLFAVCQKGNVESFDVLITNGKIVDGTGNPWFYGDIGINGDTIAEIGDLSERTASKIIDAQSLVVSPGFIDIHTHCERGLEEIDSNANLNYLTQGVTTVITGNCGGGTFAITETKAKLKEQGIGTNAIMQVGHGTLRREVMGVEPRDASPEELEKMKELLRQAMKEGAWGLSVGLEYIPSRYGSTEEVIDLVKVVGEFGGIYNSHQRDEDDRVPWATEETVRIAEETGVHAEVAHFKYPGKSSWGKIKEAIKVFEDARARGISITADMYAYNKSATSPLIRIFQSPDDMEPLAGLEKKMSDRSLPGPERDKLRAQYAEELGKALSDKTKREKIRELTLKGTPHAPSTIALWGWDSHTIMAAKKNSHLVGKIISDIAEEQNKDPFDVAADLIIDEPDVYSSEQAMLEDDVQYFMKQDWVMISSDGSARPIIKEGDQPQYGHPRIYGNFPRILRKYVREDKVLTLENAVRKMTSLPASSLQLKKRGLLVRGHKADITIFNPETIEDNATYLHINQYSTGVEYVIINGVPSIEKGEYSGALNGKVLLLTENE